MSSVDGLGYQVLVRFGAGILESSTGRFFGPFLASRTNTGPGRIYLDRNDSNQNDRREKQNTRNSGHHVDRPRGIAFQPVHRFLPTEPHVGSGHNSTSLPLGLRLVNLAPESGPSSDGRHKIAR